MLTKEIIVSVVLYWLLICTTQCSYFAENVTKMNFIYNVYEYDTLINIMVNSTTEQILDFDETSDKWRHLPTRVHVSTTDAVDGDHPVLITASQQKGVSSWELPLVVQTSNWRWRTNDMARTLCPHDAGPNITTVNRPSIQITTSNPTDVPVTIKLRRVTDFFIAVDKEVVVNATPSSPKYYYFSFDSDPPPNNTIGLQLPSLRFNYTIPKSVILIVESDDDICAVISIQNNSCPVFDNEQDVNYQGYHLTMMNKGGITLTQSMFPVGFYVVFIVKQSDEDCTSASETPIHESDLQATERMKSFRFKIIATISYKEYVVAALVFLTVFMLLLALTALISCFPTKCTEQVVIVDEEPAPSTSAGPSDETPLYPERLHRSDSLTSEESEPRVLALQLPPTVARLSHRATHVRRSDRYFWSALTVAVVYALPVVQLLFMYQRMVFQTGNQDLCYYNFFCAHPLGPLADFNHVFSNVGYVILGVAFMAQVRVRQVRQRKQDAPLGIPPHHGIFYSMGLALGMEGILSACYHLCPNKMNFQFDSSFMYVIAVLCMVKLYQNRHPDVNANAHSTFMLLAVVMTIGLFGIMYPSIYFWVFFTVLHLATCFMITMKIYYFGQFKMERAIFGRAIAAFKSREGSLAELLRPAYGARATLLAAANVANWALAGYGMYEHNKDLARHLLAILMGNAVLYLLAYVIMKLAHKEKVPLRAWVFCALAHVSWAVAIYLFLDGHTRWADTPAQSRRRNAVCSSLQFLDSHDLWHAASAAALYLSFNMLLAIDDPLADTPRELIPVF